MTYDAPTTYAKLIAPRYSPIANALVGAAKLREGDDVLELGAGTGLVTKLAAPAVRSLVATDAAPQMLGYARRHVRRAPGLSYAIVNYTQPLPFLDASFDVILSGLNFVQDLRPTLLEMERVLKSNGRIAVSMWGPQYHEKTLMNAALAAVGGGRFPSAGTGRAVQRLERLGWRGVKRTDHAITNTFANVDDYIAYRRGFGRPAVWSAAYYDRFLRALYKLASHEERADGMFELGWVQTIITARRPARA